MWEGEFPVAHAPSQQPLRRGIRDKTRPGRCLFCANEEVAWHSANITKAPLSFTFTRAVPTSASIRMLSKAFESSGLWAGRTGRMLRLASPTKGRVRLPLCGNRKVVAIAGLKNSNDDLSVHARKPIRRSGRIGFDLDVGFVRGRSRHRIGGNTITNHPWHPRHPALPDRCASESSPTLSLVSLFRLFFSRVTSRTVELQKKKKLGSDGIFVLSWTGTSLRRVRVACQIRTYFSLRRGCGAGNSVVADSNGTSEPLEDDSSGFWPVYAPPTTKVLEERGLFVLREENSALKPPLSPTSSPSLLVFVFLSVLPFLSAGHLVEKESHEWTFRGVAARRCAAMRCDRAKSASPRRSR